MKAVPRVLVAFNTTSAYPHDYDFTEELKLTDWQTEADVLAALRSLEYPCETVGIYDDMSVLQKKIESFRPTVIFNLIERFKNDAAHEADAVSYLKLLGIPFTGCGPTAITFCKDKGLAKQILSHHRIRVPQFVILPFKKKVHLPKRFPFPVFVKPLKEEASVGISQASLVETETQFKERVQFLHDTLNQDVIAEQYIAGREIYVGVMGSKRLEVFPFREMVFSRVDDEDPKIATYKAKWDEAYRKKWGIKNKFADDLPKELEDKIKSFSKRICRALSIRGAVRLDLRLMPDGKVYFIEANPNPMLAKDEDFALSALKAGWSYPELIQRLINLALAEEE
ncbi:MAG TPA: hypothetical protein PLY88_00280 [Candidatus Omnitrophota bacterium]|nr:hypothetical protein [Candidatus Omnitrophota bacterium]